MLEKTLDRILANKAHTLEIFLSETVPDSVLPEITENICEKLGLGLDGYFYERKRKEIRLSILLKWKYPNEAA